MEKSVDMFRDFDVLGVTDQEPGPSLIEKCKNLARIRRSLTSEGLDIPIHIFGCFEPMSIILMCLLGGDIFDGLSWTRYSVGEDNLRTAGSISFFERKWSIDDTAIRRMSTSQNLSQMTELMFRLRSFARTHDYATLGLSEKTEDLAKSILTQATKELV